MIWYKNCSFFNVCQIKELLSKSSSNLNKIHSHSHLIQDPESACYDDFGGGHRPLGSDRKMQIQDPGPGVAVAVDFMQKYKHFWTEFLIFDKN